MRSRRSGSGGDRRRNRGIGRLGLGDPSGVLPNRPWMDEFEDLTNLSLTRGTIISQRSILTRLDTNF